MFDIVMGLADGEDLDINLLKQHVAEFAAKITKDEEFVIMRDQLKAKCLIELKGVPEKVPTPAADASTPSKQEAKAEPATENKPVSGVPK